MPVSHGSRHQNRVASIPIRAAERRRLVPSARCAAARIALHAVGQDTPYSAATPAVARSRPAWPICRRHRSVTRALAGNASVASVKLRREQPGVSHRSARFVTTSRHGRPCAGASITVAVRYDFTRPENTPQPGHGASGRVRITHTTNTPSRPCCASVTVYSSSPTRARATSSAARAVASLIWGLSLAVV